MLLLEETPLHAPDGMVTLTALKWTGVSPSVGNLVEATTVRVAAGAGGGIWPAAEAASAAAHTRKLPIVVARMWFSSNKFISIDQALSPGTPSHLDNSACACGCASVMRQIR